MAATVAGPGTPARPAPGVTAGSAGHGPSPVCGTWARSPPLRVSHASAGHVCGLTAKATSDPADPAWAVRHSAGVADADTSVQRSPEIPTMTTCGDTAGPGCAPGWAAAWARPGPTPVSTAARTAATARTPSSIRRANVPFTGGRRAAVNGIRLGRARRAQRGPAWPPLQGWLAVTATAAFSASRAELCRLASGWSKGPPQRNPNWLSAFLALSQMDLALARMNER